MQNSEMREEMIACFNGDEDRHCGMCEAHWSRGGPCCFGDKFDPDDEECGECIHQVDCQEETEKKYMEDNVGIKINRTRPYSANRPYQNTYQSPYRPTYQQNSWQQPPRPVAVEPEEYAEGESPFDRFLKDAIWEGVTGFFSGALGFFHAHKWR